MDPQHDYLEGFSVPQTPKIEQLKEDGLLEDVKEKSNGVID
jgi:hypothetical protein